MSETPPSAAVTPPEARSSVLGWLGIAALIALFGVSLFYYPPLADASQAVERPDWIKFLGRFHVVALHLPVGVLILAALMELAVVLRFRSSSFLSPALSFTLMVGAWGAVIAVIFGIFLSRRGGFENAEFYAHQALGIAAAIGAVLTVVLKLATDRSARFAWIYRGVFAVTLAVLAVGAHFGGNLVHESDYLIKYAPEPVRNAVERFETAILERFEPPQSGPEGAVAEPGAKVAPKTSTAAFRNATVYAALIAPILADKCNSCHNEEKSKGDLRLDSHEFIMQGGVNGAVVVAGDPEQSKLITSMRLPLEDDEHMPPPKKPQPSSDEIALLTWWVKEGASKDLKVGKARLPGNLKALAQTLLTTGKSGSAGGPPPLMLTLAEAAAQADPAVAEAMKRINGTGASLAPIAADAKELRFTALNVARDYADANLKDLEPIAGKIVALDLARTKITDAACAVIARMTALRELHLENTAVTDAGAAQLKSLANLEYLNLYGTKVTDKTLTELGGLGKLKALYLWQSGVTKAGVDAFKARHPGAVVNAGWTDADNAKVVAVADPKTAPPAKPGDKPPAPAPAPAKPAPAPAAPAVAAAPARQVDPNAPLYQTIIAPIIEAKCVSCHGQEKSKGKLRMHTFADLMKGGSDGPNTVIAGKPGESLMLQRINLPLDDDDHMPPKDEKQTTKEEAAILKWWVEQGASATLTLAAARKTPEIEAMLKTLVATAATPAAGAKTAQKPKAKPLTPDEKKAVAGVTAKMTALNASLMQVALDTEQLRFGCVNAADKFGDKELAELGPVAPHLVWVDLARSKVGDAGLAILARMSALERLHLENTAVTDAGLAHLAGLQRLEYLNLYGTKITDAGLERLAGLKSLKKLFVWQTGVTAAGAKKLEGAIPGLVVNIGLSEAEIAKLIEQAKPPQPVAPPKPAEKKPEVKPTPPPAKPADPAKPAAQTPAKPADAAKPAAPPAKPEKK